MTGVRIIPIFADNPIIECCKLDGPISAHVFSGATAY